MTVRDSITRTRARTPGVEDDPTSATVRDRALGPTQCGISDVATKCTKGGRKPNICRCMLGAVLSWRCLGRHRLRCQPCSRIGENPPYGMIGGIEETSASSKPDPRLDPTRLRGGRSVMSVPTAISEMSSQIILLKGRHLASVLQECRENANIDAGWRFIWRIADDIVPTAISSLQSAYQSLRPVSGRGAEDSYETRLHKVILEG